MMHGSPRRARRSHRLMVALLTVALPGGCESTNVPTDAGVAAYVEITPREAVLGLGQSQQFAASVFDSSNRLLNGQPVHWSVADTRVASITQEGRVTAMAAGATTVRAEAGGKSASAGLTVSANPPAVGDINVNPGQTFQTMVGWEASAFVGQWECPGGLPGLYFPTTTYERYRDAVFDSALVFGINRLRVETIPGAENPRDAWSEFAAGQIDFRTWAQTTAVVVNDNNDPFLINPAGFHFSVSEDVIDKVVLPLRQRLQARGEKLYFVFNYIAFAGRGVGFEHRNFPEEYAEFMLAAFQRFRSKYGFVPDAIEIILEPDWGNSNLWWTPRQIGDLIVATGNRMRAAGFSPDIIAPSTADMTNALTYFDQMAGMPGVMQHLTELGYHRYSGVSAATLSAIGQRTVQHRIRSIMNEHIGSGYEDLHADLTVGRNSAWQQYALAACGADDGSGGSFFMIDVTDPLRPVVRPTGRAQFLRRYFAHVRRGAIRIGATSLRTGLDPVAFINADGRHTVVVKAAAAASFSVGGLPPGTYRIAFTTGPDDRTPRQLGDPQTDIVLAAGQALQASIPDKGILTVYRR